MGYFKQLSIASLPFYTNEETDADRLLMLLEDSTNGDDYQTALILTAALNAINATMHGNMKMAESFAPGFAAYRARL